MENDRETLELDVLFVGAGPANLAAALHLARLVERHNASATKPLEPAMAILEKGKEIGSHALSGAVLDPRCLKELFPDSWQDAPLEGQVEHERLLFLTERRGWRLPVPPPLDNHGNYVVSLGRLLKWMAPQVEAAGVDIFCEFPATEILYEENRVAGVRTGDRGVDKEGKRKTNFEPGIDIRSRATVLGEGPRGSLAKTLESRFDLCQGANPQVYAIGLKEVWQLPDSRVPAGEVLHTMGWPLDRHTFGGGFVYGMRDNQVIVGFVAGLDYQDPRFDPHLAFQQFKTHPKIAPLLEGGSMTVYGAKAIPEGGFWAMPRPYGDGFLLVGDSAGFLNGQRLKGIHLAMRSGMLAAEVLFSALVADDFSASQLSAFSRRVQADWSGRELYKVRNFHQGFDHGLYGGLLQAGLGFLTGGRGWGVRNRLSAAPGHTRLRSLALDDSKRVRAGSTATAAAHYDGVLTFDRLADVYHSGTAHEEDQPSHLLVHDTSLCVGECAEKYGNPCERFCPAQVYEIVREAKAPGGRRLQINASNCVHCKTCDIMDPYQIIDWVPPEGGGGPNYNKM